MVQARKQCLTADGIIFAACEASCERWLVRTCNPKAKIDGAPAITYLSTGRNRTISLRFLVVRRLNCRGMRVAPVRSAPHEFVAG